IDIVSLGRKSRDYFRRRYPVATESSDSRKGGIQIVGEYVGLMNRTQLHSAQEIANKIIKLYTEGKVDSVYIVYNEFKSVIAQRLVVDDVLPIRAIGETVHEFAEEVTGEERTRRLEAAAHAHTSVREVDTTEMD